MDTRLLPLQEVVAHEPHEDSTRNAKRGKSDTKQDEDLAAESREQCDDHERESNRTQSDPAPCAQIKAFSKAHEEGCIRNRIHDCEEGHEDRREEAGRVVHFPPSNGSAFSGQQQR